MGLLYELELTVAAGQITGTQEANWAITEANVGSGFWNNVSADGGNIRLYAGAGGTSRLPIDVVGVNTGSQELQVYVLDSLAVSDSVFLRLIEKTASQPSVTDTYGRNNAYRSDCLAWFTFDEDPSGTAPQIVDHTGNGNDLTSTGSMTSGDVIAGAVFGKGVALDGSDDYLLKDNSSISISSAAANSFIWWWRTNNITDPNSFGRIVWTLEDDYTAPTDNVKHTYGNTTTPAHIISTAGGNTGDQTGLTTGTWRHEVLTWDQPNDNLDWYENGASIYSNASYTDNSVAQDLILGWRPGSGSQFHSGDLDEWGAFNSILTADESDAFYNNQSDPGAFWDEGTEKVFGMPPMTGDVL